MTSIPMHEFSRDSTLAMLKVRQGEAVELTENGEVIAHILPASGVKPSEEVKPAKQNGLLWMCELGEKLIPPGPVETLTNAEMDRIIYDH